MSSTGSTRREQLIRSFREKAFRDAYVASLITIGLPAQIREMRQGRGWYQTDLGKRADMPQGLISRFETKGYSAFTLRTLRKLAAAFDVGLKVRFVPFSELVDDAAYPGKSPLDVPSFDADMHLEEASNITALPGSETSFLREVQPAAQVFERQITEHVNTLELSSAIEGSNG